MRRRCLLLILRYDYRRCRHALFCFLPLILMPFDYVTAAASFIICFRRHFAMTPCRLPIRLLSRVAFFAALFRFL